VHHFARSTKTAKGIGQTTRSLFCTIYWR